MIEAVASHIIMDVLIMNYYGIRLLFITIDVPAIVATILGKLHIRCSPYETVMMFYGWPPVIAKDFIYYSGHRWVPAIYKKYIIIQYMIIFVRMIDTLPAFYNFSPWYWFLCIFISLCIDHNINITDYFQSCFCFIVT